MLDFNTKFDRPESTAVLGLDEIRELVSSRLSGSEIESVSLLAGGFVNSNYRLVLRDSTSLVLRIASKRGDLKKELRILKHIKGAVPVPAVIAEDFSGPHPFALIEFVTGMRFSDRLGSLDVVDLNKVAAEAGVALQAIHSFDLGKAGFFDENFAFDPAFENFGGSFYNYILFKLRGWPGSGKARGNTG